MSSQKDTVTMTVEIPKPLRNKLGRLKGIYGCDTLGCALSTVIEDVSFTDVFNMMANKESNDAIPTQSNPIVTNDPSTDEEGKMISFCKKLLIDLKVADMDELDTYIDSGIVIIENKLLPKRSPVGEIPEDIEWEEE